MKLMYITGNYSQAKKKQTSEKAVPGYGRLFDGNEYQGLENSIQRLR